jgi:hypothetical protein
MADAMKAAERALNESRYPCPLHTMHRDSEAVALEARAAAIQAEQPAAELSKRTSETR